MFPMNHLYVAAHLDEMRKQAASERFAKSQSASHKPDLGAAARSVRSFFGGPAERPMTLPTLTNYPYRG